MQQKSANAQKKDERKKKINKENMNGEEVDVTLGLMVKPESTSTQGSGKKSRLGRPDGCIGCIRYILIVGNCIFFFLGCTVIGLGIYVVVDKVHFVTGVFGMTMAAPASYLIIASGCVIFVISFIGCFGALFESRPLIAIYSTSLSVVLVLSCIGFTLALLFRAKVTDQIQIYMTKTLQNDYGVNLDEQWNHFVTESWNKAQAKWQCCAVKDDSWSIYHISAWYQGLSNDLTPVVPPSCCKLDASGEIKDISMCQKKFAKDHSPDENSTDFTMAINTKGCYEEGKRVMREISGYLICIGVITAILVVGGLALSIHLARKV